MKKLLVSIFVLCILVVNNFNSKDSFATKSIKYNGENLLVNVDGVKTETLPVNGSYYLADYDCNDTNISLDWDKENYELKVSGKKDTGNLACYLDFQSQPFLSSMEVGSYVKYVGNNGCFGNLCKGNNANYLNDNDMGYCGNDSYKFITNGFRIGYKKDGNAYLVSAGALECICSNSDSSISNNSCGNSLSKGDINKHISNLNDVSLKYCNSDYVSGGICDKSTTWAFNDDDYKRIVKNTLKDCYSKFGDKSCGYANDLIDNGGIYSVVGSVSDLSNKLYNWNPNYRGIDAKNSSYLSGVRPVIKIDSNVIVVGGNGTYNDPYLIDNNTFYVNEGNNYVIDKSNVRLSLIANDRVKSMCISYETSGCDNYVEFEDKYVLNLKSEDDGEGTIYVYYKDSVGNVIASFNKNVVLDSIGPSENSIKIGNGNSLIRKLILKSNGANYMCLSNSSSDVSKCNNWVNYTTSYNWELAEGDGTKTVYVFFKDKAGNISNVVSDSIIYNRNCLEIDESYSLDYIGKVVNSESTNVKFCEGIYKLELWGAQGGNSGGNGGYSSGEIKLNGTEKLYFYVGGSGGKGNNIGFNGGGSTGSSGGAGGGASDIRINSDSLYARVIVAGGGGGSGKDKCAIGGAGGGIIGEGKKIQNSCGIQAEGGTQVSGGNVGTYSTIRGFSNGSFGFGGNASDGMYDGGAGGGGWYGGGAGASSDWSNGGGGGSGFVYTNESILPNGYLVGTNYYLSKTIILNGNQNNIPNRDSAVSNSSNGYIKITRLS